MMKPFLQKVAEVYAVNESSDLSRYCFVLPNRRSCTFFESYLSKALEKTKGISPEILSITDFIERQSKLVEAGRVELLLLLYQTYRQLAEKDKAEPAPFDQFLYLGDTLLSDFNDIDRYLVDAQEVYKNVRDLNDIQTDYLTDEQRAVIKEYWGVDKTPSGQDSLFLQSSVQSSYFNMWNNLYELYADFKEALKAQHLAYGGMSYRKVAEAISDEDFASLGFDRLVMVGFSTLSSAEEKIFKYLRDSKRADFYWDFESPFLDEDNKGSYFLNKYVKEYPSKYDIVDTEKHIPNINILSVPSGSGQGQVVGSILSRLVKDGIVNAKNAVDTAVVLPEEKYVNSVLSSVPEEFDKINITMGMSVRQSPIASFMANLADLEKRKQTLKDEVNYFYEDIEMVASHPYAMLVCGSEISKLVETIREKNAFFVPLSMIKSCSDGLSVLFGLDAEPMQYLKKLLDVIYRRLEETEADVKERFFVSQYIQALNQIESTLETFHIEAEKRSLFYILSRSMAGAIVPFEGKPLRGLQIMGVLETRLLDFKNIIVLSMNEKVFPTKHYTKSFIPNGIRAAFGLSTFKFQDSMYAYYFFRMISRAENVFLVYDSRTQSLSSGEESRYIKQIKQIYNRNKNYEIHYAYDILAPTATTVAIEKTQRIMDILEKFRSSDDDKRYLSASSLNTYIDCPFKFYLQKVEGLNEEEEITDFIDSPTFGTVVHRALEKAYASQKSIDKAFFDKYLKGNKPTIELEKVVTYAVNRDYKLYPETKCLNKLDGEALLIGKIVMYYVKNTLIYDRRMGEFSYVAGEKKLAFYWDFGDGVGMNFKCFIDRIDNVDGRLRIVDYKTGKDDVVLKDADGFEDLFASKSRKKAILQLLLYCNAYAMQEKYASAIQPIVYQLKEICQYTKENFALRLGKPKGPVLENYLDLDNSLFLEKMKSVVGEIFDKDKKFAQTKDRDKCKYCQFRKICIPNED